ncbi:hypothetical protein [Capnocytophaga catalasegens]|uniref:Uncharacterized protein n=1 Tax=Capnocytophaga catalasegens TaxID=1004260 RepID=A0AAV5AU69_9FLAO|nr:hypothetical protein [Capnocytophaga catalasegens]GIZ14046.1 hypothetical protein RCZ03_00470 [Capnocytophaga catalasegens]GJM49043.1 hypothetical protein RCZ15_00190 [Capnocytophaga catalasegens]GJM52304.1 hypothetical protein RCZ16_06220 [Capnocytophaga catalasegens]
MSENQIQNEKNQSPKKKNQHISVEEWIQKMRLAFSNGKLPNIQEQVKPLGYTLEALDELYAKVVRLEELHQVQKTEYAKQYAATSKFDQKFAEINELYSKHLAFCKILFKGDKLAASSLDFSGKRKMAYSDWLVQVGNFYSQLLKNPIFMSKLQTISIKEEDLKMVQDKLSEIIFLKETQKKETAQAQKSTEIRDKYFNELHKQYIDFVAYAKVALSQAQDLEALGIVTKRN